MKFTHGYDYFKKKQKLLQRVPKNVLCYYNLHSIKREIV